MERLLLITLFLLTLTVTKAQDKIVTIYNDTIECRIISVGNELINYEQKISESLYSGKSIAVSEVVEYFRSRQHHEPEVIYKSRPRLPKPERRYLLNINGGMGRSFMDFDQFSRFLTSMGITSPEANDFTGRLKNGYHVTADFHYLLTTFLGLGAGYNLFHSFSAGNFLLNRTGAMNLPMFEHLGLNEKIYTHFAGPSVLLQQLPGRNGKLKISETLSPGIVFFRNESRGNEYQIHWGDYEYGQRLYYEHVNALTKSTAFGIRGGLSFEYAVAQQLSAGLAGNFIWAKINKASFKRYGYETDDQELENAVDISHLDYGFTLRYNF